jgi:predicted RNA-binding protein with PIN domain
MGWCGRGTETGVLIVDGNNVVGSRPDGWWRDRVAAAARLIDAIGRWAEENGEQDVVVVFDGREPAGFPAPPGVTVRFAERAGRDAADDDIAALVARAERPEDVTVVTSDRGLVSRVRAHGATVSGARGFRELIEQHP